MHFTQTLIFALMGLVAAEKTSNALMASGPKHILQATNGGPSNVIRGLLDSSRVSSRQASGCDAGYDVCDVNYCCAVGEACCTGGFCCQAGTYCDTVSGQLGCCQIGVTCTETSNKCSSAGYSPCPSDTYCCPTGDTCYRDSSGNANCASGSGGGGGSSFPSVSIPFVNTQTSQSSAVIPATNSKSNTVVFNTQTTPLSVSVPSTTSSRGSGLGLLPSSGMRSWSGLSGLVVLPVLGFAAAFIL